MKIGALTEDWETGDFSNMSWQNNSSTPWTIVTTSPYEGMYCAKSGAIGNNSNTRLTLTDTATVSDTISFYYKVSSEENYDKLVFKIDGQTKDEWSGNIGWTRAAYPVEAGVHTYQWTYSKDFHVATGDDAEEYTYRLFDLSGRLLQGGRLADNVSEINVTGYKSGTYILQVEDAQHHVQTAKIVKQ